MNVRSAGGYPRSVPSVRGRGSGRAPWASACLAALALLVLTPGASGAASGEGGKRVQPPVRVKVAERASGNVLVEWRVRRDLRGASVRVNGHRAWVRPPLDLGQRRTISLDPADGLRFGSNEIVFRVRPLRGKRAILRRTVFVARRAPLPAIVQPRRAVAGQAVRLDGRRTRAARDGELDYRWRIVRAPRGAHASLRGAGKRRPRLLATAPGRYRLALTVREQGARATAGASAVACAVKGSAPPPVGKGDRRGPLASLSLARIPAAAIVVDPRGRRKPPRPGPEARAAEGCATNVEDVKVKPNLTPLGMAFDSRASHEGQTGIQVGSEFFSLPGPGEGARFLLYDAETLALLYSTTAAVGTSAENFAESLATAWDGEHNVLIVAAGVEGCCPDDSGDSGQGFTLVENYVPGAENAASENQGQPYGEAPGTVGVNGEMSGWLQRGIPIDGPELFSFVSPERVPFDTQASAPAVNANTIRIGAQQYTSELPAGATAGYQVLVTDPALRPLLGTPVAFGTVGPGAEAEEQAMATLIASAAQQQQATLTIQSIGAPTPSSPWAAEIANQMLGFGGNRWTFLGLNGEGGYAFVGTAAAAAALGLTATSAEASNQWARSAGGSDAEGEGALRGLLRRTRVGGFAPLLAGSLGAPDYGLAEVTYQPTIPWPQTQSGGRAAATTWLAEDLGLTPGPGSCYQPAEPDFRSSYCDQTIEPNTVRRELENVDYPASESNRFGKLEFEEVKAQLETELGYVAKVRRLFAVLQEPLGKQSPAVRAEGIAAEIVDAIPTPRASATSGDLAFASSILYAATEVPEVGEVLGPIASLLDIASQLTQENGQPSPDWAVQAAAGQIGEKVQERLTLMSGGLGAVEEIVVSDWGKLSTVAADADSAWGISSNGIEEERATIELGISQWMWTAIAPAAYDLVSFRLEDFPGIAENAAREFFCVYSRAPEEWYPWRNAWQQSVFYPLASFREGRPRSLVAFGMLSGSFEDKDSTPVSESVGRQIFGAPPNGAGMVPPWLLERARWQIEEPRMIDEGESPLVPGWCGANGYPQE